MWETDEEKSLQRFNRAVIAAGSAVVIAVATAGYAVYRLQEVLHGMKLNNDATTTLYYGGQDPRAEVAFKNGK